MNAVDVNENILETFAHPELESDDVTGRFQRFSI